MFKIKNLSKNMFFTLTYQIFFIVTTFLIRKIFLNSLGIELLGVNSVFTNILSALNLAELGIGVAITSYLYKPLVEKDNEKISILMKLYKQFYNYLGLIVLTIGIIVSFFVHVLFPSSTISAGRLQIYFLISLIFKRISK